MSEPASVWKHSLSRSLVGEEPNELMSFTSEGACAEYAELSADECPLPRNEVEQEKMQARG